MTIDIQLNPVQKKPQMNIPSKGVLLLAVGAPVYGQMAFNTALSIKAADPKAQVAIAHYGDAITNLKQEHLRIFSKVIELPKESVIVDGKAYPIRAKLLLHKYTPFDRTIFLDADTIWFNERKISWLFGELEGQSFNGQVVFAQSVKSVTMKDQFLCWGKTLDIVQNWGLDDGMIYAVNAFFWYWENRPKSKEFFERSLQIYDAYLSGKKKMDHTPWRWIPVEEVCMGIATAQLKFNLPQSFYQPIAHTTIIRAKDATNPHSLSNRYWAFTFPGTDIPSHLKQWYNETARANNQKFGIKSKPFLWELKSFSGKQPTEAQKNRNKKNEHVRNTKQVQENNRKKVDLTGQLRFSEHRSGWGYALDALSPLHNPDGIKFDGFLEQNFAWSIDQMRRESTIPYEEPWIGFLHNPPLMAPWYGQERNAPGYLINTPEFKKSLQSCKGLFVLSDYMKNWLKSRVNVPVETLIHPTETPELMWSPDRWNKNKSKRIVQLGYWLRKLTSIYLLKTPNNLLKTLLIPRDDLMNYLKPEVQYMRRQYKKHINLEKSNVQLHPRVNNQKYDELLANNIAFLDLYDTSCNNAVIECIVRNTPLLINYHPATLQYLGKDYPFYFRDLTEASRKVNNPALVIQTHEYLKKMDKTPFTKQAFLEGFQNSKIYHSI